MLAIAPCQLTGAAAGYMYGELAGRSRIDGEAMMHARVFGSVSRLRQCWAAALQARRTGDRVRLGIAAAIACFLLLAPTISNTLSAQVLRGTVRVRDADRVVDRARLVAEDRGGKRIGETVTDNRGQFLLSIGGRIGMPFRVTVSRIGLQPSLSDELTLADGDTVYADFWVKDLPVAVSEVTATAAPSLNVERYRMAKRRGWRVVEPETVAKRRENSPGFNELIVSLGLPGLIVPRRPGECVRSTRNRRCLPIIMDGILIGPSVHLNPRDIYFMAVVGASAARAEWGDRAAYGALAIYTRMNGDVLDP